MKYRFLGSSGVKVSELCLGAMALSVTGKGPFGSMPAASEADSHRILDAYVEAGGNFIDTADAYNESEQVIGNWIAKRVAKDPSFRSKIVLATKVFNLMDPSDPNAHGLSRKHIYDQVERSLKVLQTSYIDLYQVHCWDNATSQRETLSTLHQLIRDGKVRYIGCSNFSAWQLAESWWVAEKFGYDPYVSIQNQYSLIARSNEWSISEVCQRYGGIGLLPWSPLAGGLLSGKYDRSNASSEEGSRVKWAESMGWSATSLKDQQGETFFSIIDELKAIAKEVKSTPAAVALAWLLAQPAVSSVIIGARTVDQLKQNLAAAAITLSIEQIQRLDHVSASLNNKPYPFSIIEMLNGQRKRQTPTLPL